MKQLLDTIEKAKDVLNLSERELSTKIGQHYTYLGKIKKKGTSERNQQVIIEKIVNLMNGNPVTEAEIIKSLSLRLQAEQDKNIILKKDAYNGNVKITELNSNIERLSIKNHELRLHRNTYLIVSIILSIVIFAFSII